MEYFSSLQRSLYTSVRDTLDAIGLEEVEVWYGRYDALEPSKTYCILHLLEVRDVGLTSENYHYDEVNEDFISSTVTFLSAYVQFSVVGESSALVSSKLRQNIINNRKHHDKFLKNGLGITNRSSLRRVPQKTDTGWMDAFNFDITFSFSFIYSEGDVDFFDKVEIEGKVYSPEKNMHFYVQK